jgi:hypothetical protein
MNKAKDYSGMAMGGTSGSGGKAKDFSSAGTAGSSPTGTKATTYYGGTGMAVKSMGASKGETAPRAIPGVKTTNPMPAGGTRQITLPRGQAMKRRGT